MRGGPRMMCSPYLTGSLALMLVLVTFNYWSVSTNNFDLVKEVKLMQTQLKTGSGTIQERESLASGDTESFGRHPNWALDLQFLLLGTPDQDHPHLQECQVAGEGVRRPHQGRQGEGTEGQGPSEDADQNSPYHHSQNTLWRGFKNLGQVPDENPQKGNRPSLPFRDCEADHLHQHR